MRVTLVAPAMAIRLGVKALLDGQPALEVLGAAASLAEAEPLLPYTEVLIIASSQPGWPTLQDEQATVEPSIPVLFLSSNPVPLKPIGQNHGLPWGLLPLETGPEELAAAILAIKAGLFVSRPAQIRPWLAKQGLTQIDSESDGEALTQREAEVLQLLATGLANKQIAARLHLSEHTVKFHIASLYAKLAVSNRAEAVRVGARRGIITL